MGDCSTMVKKVAKGGAAPKVAFPKSAVEKQPRTFSIGGDILPKGRDLTRFIKGPKYVRLQRAKMTLLKRIKVPPAINQFSNTFDKRQASQLFRLLNNLKPETRTEKKERLKAEAAAGGKASSKRPVSCKMGINHVTTLIEEKKAKLATKHEGIGAGANKLPAVFNVHAIKVRNSVSKINGLVNEYSAVCNGVRMRNPMGLGKYLLMKAEASMLGKGILQVDKVSGKAGNWVFVNGRAIGLTNKLKDFESLAVRMTHC